MFDKSVFSLANLQEGDRACPVGAIAESATDGPDHRQPALQVSFFYLL